MGWYDEYIYTQWDQFRPVRCDEIRKNPRGDLLVAEYISADTETAHDRAQDRKHCRAWVYQWAFRYMNTVVYGRTARQLVATLERVREVNGCGVLGYDKDGREIEKRLVCYIHNLSYDWEYIKEFARELYGWDHEKILATGAHNLIAYCNGGIEYRCSLKLSLKSLDKWARDLGTRYRKYTGAIDYNETRYPDSPLGYKDWKYQFYDVIVLHECIEKQMHMYGDTLKTIPLTSTGYVRRETKKAFKAAKYAHAWFMKTALQLDTYLLCRAEFAGGITHGNRFRADETIKATIRHRDFRSHYPTQQKVQYCPAGRWVHRYKYTAGRGYSMQKLKALADKKCILARIYCEEIELKNNRETLPYISGSKLKAREKPGINILDNGRVLHYKGKCEIVVNEIDLKYILKQYRLVCQVLDVWESKRGPFPAYLVETVDKFFKGKSDKKDVVKALEKSGVDEYAPEMIEANFKLMAEKALLNGIYGMSATDPVRAVYREYNGIWSTDDQDPGEQLEKYYSSWGSFMSYQLGAWTTAHARGELMQYYYIIGPDNFLYADTDSIFYISNPEVEKRIDDMEKKKAAQNMAAGNYITTDKGKTVLYDVFELEPEEITAFRFLHSKCYAYTTSDGKLHTTIAGVKRIGRKGWNRVKELKTIDNLKDNYIFTYCGGIGKAYPEHDGITQQTIDGHKLETGGGCILFETTKTLHNMESWLEVPDISFSPQETIQE